MNRFARSAALGGAALVALVLALAASATSSKSDRSAAPSAGAAVTNYLTYVQGTRGKADPKKSKVYIGWVNQQGGQVVIGGLATAGAAAGREVRERPARRRRRSSRRARRVLHQVERGGRHDLRAEARQRQADLRHRDGRRRHGSPVALRDDPRREAGRHRCRHHPGRRSAEERASSSSATRPHILLPFGTYAKNVLKAKTAAVIYPQATGITEAALVIAAGLKQAGHRRRSRSATRRVRPT